VQVDYLGEAHLRDLFPQRIARLLVIPICRSHCFQSGRPSVQSFYRRRRLLIGLLQSAIQDHISSTRSFSHLYSPPSCRALFSGQLCLGIHHLTLVCLHTIQIDVRSGVQLLMISCFRKHSRWAFPIHAASHEVFWTVLESDCSHFISGLHSVISDRDRLQYKLLLSRTELEPASQ